MKKNLFIILTIFVIGVFNNALANTDFINALDNCDEYQKNGSIPYQGEVFNLTISLNKTRNDKCLYKEKIYQGDDYQMLTCSFTKEQLSYIKDSMIRYSEMFSKQLAKNNIFEAKLTTNGEVFQKYLADPNICKITHSKR